MNMMENSRENGEEVAVRVPPGFRFHPTDEELLYYYLRKKVSYEPIDLDVIREIDLNRLEPWDLKDKCAIGSGPQNEWYFFSHKDKKYPTGTRTNRATAAGFWKATGRDKAIHHSDDSKTIGMRKTLVFYTGRAPHGHKTDWIMHEYRLHDDIINQDLQEEGWVICRVFKKKVHSRSGFHPYQDDDFHVHTHGNHPSDILPPNGDVPSRILQDHHHHHHHPHHKHMIHNLNNLPNLFNNNNYTNTFLDDHITATNPSMHLPQLLSPDIAINSIPSAATSLILSSLDPLRQQLIVAPAAGGSGTSTAAGGLDKLSGDWSFLDKLLPANHGLQEDQIGKCTSSNPTHQQVNESFNNLVPLQAQKFLPFPNCHNFDEPDLSRFAK